MEPLDRMASIERRLKQLCAEIEALKADLSGKSVPDFRENKLGVQDQMKDFLGIKGKKRQNT